MDLNKKLELIKRNSAEIIGENRIKEILKLKKPVTYCGYETSGDLHLGHLVTITKLMDLQRAGFHVKVLLADWHTWLNRKGDWNFIHKQCKIWENGFRAAGLKAEFILGSKFQRNLNYIDDVLTLALNTTMNRALRSMQEIARDFENAKVSQVIYPLMQIADIKHLKIDLVHAGIEQRKIHALGIELLSLINYKVPVFVHTPLISSLKGPGKMSSSEPESMISINDNNESINKKINNAYCPEGIAENNPILQIMKLIVFPRNSKVIVERPSKFGGNSDFNNYDELEKIFINKKLHPQDLKNSCAEYLIKILTPIRKKFKK
ncbi:MAG: tyrosine--tRNA ligase [Nanoarchaeota archaeon]